MFNATNMDLNKLTASKIKEIRLKQGLTAESVASQLGIAKANYSRLENGKVDISLNRLEALSKIFKLPLQSLLPAGGTQTIQVTNGDNSPIAHNISNNVDPALVSMLQTSLQILSSSLEKMK
jgi:transcriptional regulator with XRE-family HTH domain